VRARTARRRRTAATTGVGDALHQPHHPLDQRSRDADDQQCRTETDERARQDVGRVVGADDDTADGDHGGCSKKDRADEAVEKEDGERDAKRSACMIGRKRGVMGAATPTRARLDESQTVCRATRAC